MNLPLPVWKKNDRRARVLIIGLSVVVFIAVVVLGRVKVDVDPGFDVRIFARANAFINATVSLLLVAGMITVKKKRYELHRRMMSAAILLSVLFLLSYVAHHLLAGETRYGDVDHDGLLSAEEKAAAGSARLIYYSLLGTHIPLAGIILPFILFTAYRSMTGEYEKHRRLARITWPVWLYVSVTGVIIYLMINPYYG
ncbi:MAG TPA: DUF420 domain-containing protein [Chitinophagaceae bacterium]|nr:DUF420 domain-containing protein [Chitinophagaceae bacterium]